MALPTAAQSWGTSSDTSFLRAYLDDWAAPDSGWLRKYCPDGSDEPHYDATPAVERALQWVDALRERSFVGTASRLNAIFDLLQADPVSALAREHTGSHHCGRKRRKAERRAKKNAADSDGAQ
jgi:hypothetical protein